MSIRKAGKEDLRSLALLFDEYRVFHQKESDVIAAATFLKLRIEKKDSKIYVAVNSEQELMGFIIASNNELNPDYAIGKKVILGVTNPTA